MERVWRRSYERRHIPSNRPRSGTVPPIAGSRGKLVASNRDRDRERRLVERLNSGSVEARVEAASQLRGMTMWEVASLARRAARMRASPLRGALVCAVGAVTLVTVIGVGLGDHTR